MVDKSVEKQIHDALRATLTGMMHPKLRVDTLTDMMHPKLRVEFDPDTAAAQLLMDKVGPMVPSAGWSTSNVGTSAHSHSLPTNWPEPVPEGPARVGIFGHMVDGTATELNANLVAACLKSGKGGFEIGVETLIRLWERAGELTDATVECIVNTIGITTNINAGQVLWAISGRLAPKPKEE